MSSLPFVRKEPAVTATALAPVKADELGDYMKQANGWEADRERRRERSEKRAWRCAAGATLLALVSGVGLIAHEMRPVVAPPVIVVDKLTGNNEIIRATDDVSKQYSELLTKHWSKRYVIAREGYQYTNLQYDYDSVLAWSSDDVGRTYAKMYEGDSARDKKLGAGSEERVNVISVVLPPDENRTCVVRYEKTVKKANSDAFEAPRTYVATFAYEFKPSSRGKEKDLIENPLGFKVTAYRTDAELVSPGAQ